MSEDKKTGGQSPSTKRRLRLRLTRDTVIFLTGLGGIVHETVISYSERPTLILLFGSMIGLPAFLRRDESRKKENPS